MYEFSDNTENLTEILENLDEIENYYGENRLENEYNKLYLDIYDRSFNKVDKAYVYVFNINNPELKNSLGEKIKNNDFLNISPTLFRY